LRCDQKEATAGQGTAHEDKTMHKSGRRAFLRTGVISAASLSTFGTAGGGVLASAAKGIPLDATASAPPFKLGLVTYNLAHDWDIDTIIKNC